MRGLQCLSDGCKFRACLLILLSCSALVYAFKPDLRGIDPADKAFFAGKKISCRDGSKEIPIQQVNDNFCDCADGTDEPGTSACSEGRFYCRNRGHAPLTVFSSRVNDGICDCCDGSDEYEGRVKCNNTCREMGAESRQKLAEDVAMYKEGAKLKEGFEAEAKKLKEEWAEEIKKTAKEVEELKTVESRLAEEKAVVEKVEAEEREREEKLRKEQEEKDKAAAAAAAPSPPPAEETKQVAAEGEGEESRGSEGAEDSSITAEEEEAAGGETDTDASEHDVWGKTVDDSHLEPGVDEHGAEQQEHAEQQEGAKDGAKEEEESLEGLTADEIGARVAARWTGGGGGAASHTAPPPSPAPSPAGDPAHDDVADPTADRDAMYDDRVQEDDDDDDDDDDDIHDSMRDDLVDAEEEDDRPFQPPDADSSDSDDDGDYDEFEASTPQQEDAAPLTEEEEEGSWWSRLLHWPANMSRKLIALVSPSSSSSSLPRSSPEKAEAERVKKEHRKAAEQLRKLQAQISALKTKLANDYGPSGQFVKMAEQCFSLTLNQYVYEVCPYSKAIQKEGHITTRLGEWGGFADNYSQMKFERGDQCWNGPPRSLTVKLRCGLGNQISSVDEPSRCEYTAILTTPAACDIAQAKALEEELEAKERELTGPGEHDEL